MAPSLRRNWLLLSCSSLAIACATAKPAAPATQPPARTAEVTPRAPDELYAVDEALRDALSGPLEFLGSGAWPGNNRIQACAYRNKRVLVVNAYCSVTEQQAFRVDVYSATRGRVRVYAESDGPVSMRTREQYFTFTAESEPAPSRTAQLPPLTLGMSFEQLRQYEELRYGAYLPGCYGGQERSRARSGCLGALESRAATWSNRNRTFLANASSDWLRVVRELRGLAALHGRDPQ